MGYVCSGKIPPQRDRAQTYRPKITKFDTKCVKRKQVTKLCGNETQQPNQVLNISYHVCHSENI